MTEERKIFYLCMLNKLKNTNGYTSAVKGSGVGVSELVQSAYKDLVKIPNRLNLNEYQEVIVAAEEVYCRDNLSRVIGNLADPEITVTLKR
jgi:hypothetical protein